MNACYAQPPATTAEYAANECFAGIGVIFGLFPPDKCQNCGTRPPFDVTVDVTAALRRQSLTRASAAVKVMVRDEDGKIEAREDTPVPTPLIRGPLFESTGEWCTHTAQRTSRRTASRHGVGLLQGEGRGRGVWPVV